MLFVLFYVGDDRYVVDAKKVIEIVPLVKLSSFPNTADYVAGLCNYRAVPVPVIDIHCLLEGSLSESVMSTRIVLVNYVDHAGDEHHLGLIVEHATETISLGMDCFHRSASQASDHNYVSNMMTDERGIIQWIDVDGLLSRHDCDVLYGRLSEAGE